MPYVVRVIESERGWGQKIVEQKIFLTKEEATSFVVEFNSENTCEEVPDWYAYAEEPFFVPALETK